MTDKKKNTQDKAEFDFRTIKSFEDACKHLGIDPTKLPDVSMIPEEFAKPIIANYKLTVVYKAINNGWRPDWSNWDQYKYFPWLSVLSSGFGFSGSYYGYGHSNTYVGSRLCTDSREKALYIAEQFQDEYKDFFLYPEGE
ncbi:hypothetical protein [Maribellus mangrovi]|uniref:hypothetical protein n=1 Tax=Maribellus mangrovi TaxID=3133146 RepID=UPI0030ED43F5